MPQLYYLNPPPNPFWDFVSGLEDHPFLAGPPRPTRRFRRGPPSFAPPQAADSPVNPTEAAHESEMSEKARGKRASVEDPPEVDPSTVKPQPTQSTPRRDEKDLPYRGRGRFARALEGENDGCRRAREGHPRGGHPCRGGRGRSGWNGPPPFALGHPFFARPPWAQHGAPTPPGSVPGIHHDSAHAHPPHAGGLHGSHREHGPPHRHPRGFDLGDFLNNLGDKLGVDLSTAAEGLGLTADRSGTSNNSQEVNFEPRTDIFENQDDYIIHLSLPGAKKEDIAVDYDGEHSNLRVTGIVHRPDVDEQMYKQLVVDGRKREVGMFEKAVRLGTKREPASIDVSGITAKMTDGILVVKVPKVEKLNQKREIPVTVDPTTEGQADYEDVYYEKPILFDAEESPHGTSHEDEDLQEDHSSIDTKENTGKDEMKVAPDADITPSKIEEAQPVAHESEPSTQPEPLPAYSADARHDEEEDWEKFSDDSGEGEFIKIDVK